MAIVLGQTTWHIPIATGEASLGSVVINSGNLICKAGGVAWIVAPSSSEVGRAWTSRNDAVTMASACTTATTWFVPTCAQLVNPGFCCRVYWDSYALTFYWSSTQQGNYGSQAICFGCPSPCLSCQNNPTVSCIRAFRCVTF